MNAMEDWNRQAFEISEICRFGLSDTNINEFMEKILFFSSNLSSAATLFPSSMDSRFHFVETSLSTALNIYFCFLNFEYNIDDRGVLICDPTIADSRKSYLRKLILSMLSLLSNSLRICFDAFKTGEMKNIEAESLESLLFMCWTCVGLSCQLCLSESEIYSMWKDETFNSLTSMTTKNSLEYNDAFLSWWKVVELECCEDLEEFLRSQSFSKSVSKDENISIVRSDNVMTVLISVICLSNQFSHLNEFDSSFLKDLLPNLLMIFQQIFYYSWRNVTLLENILEECGNCSSNRSSSIIISSRSKVTSKKSPEDQLSDICIHYSQFLDRKKAIWRISNVISSILMCVCETNMILARIYENKEILKIESRLTANVDVDYITILTDRFSLIHKDQTAFSLQSGILGMILSTSLELLESPEFHTRLLAIHFIRILYLTASQSLLLSVSPWLCNRLFHNFQVLSSENIDFVLICRQLQNLIVCNWSHDENLSIKYSSLCLEHLIRTIYVKNNYWEQRNNMRLLMIFFSYQKYSKIAISLSSLLLINLDDLINALLHALNIWNSEIQIESTLCLIAVMKILGTGLQPYLVRIQCESLRILIFILSSLEDDQILSFKERTRLQQLKKWNIQLLSRIRVAIPLPFQSLWDQACQICSPLSTIQFHE